MRDDTPLGEVALTLFTTYRQRSLVGLALTAAQAFFDNAILRAGADGFLYPGGSRRWYLLPFAAGNFAGPLLLSGVSSTRWDVAP